jgi:hypothetical protein
VKRKLTGSQELQLSGFFRTYNLSLFSDFGLGLMRQSEFRTVSGGNATYVNKIANLLYGFLSLKAPLGAQSEHTKPARTTSWLHSHLAMWS